MEDQRLEQLKSERKEMEDKLKKYRFDLYELNKAIKLREQEICEHKFEQIPNYCFLNSGELLIEMECKKCGKITRGRATINFVNNSLI